jgi:hypothetical protein
MSQELLNIFWIDSHGRVVERDARTLRSFLRQLGAAGA